MAAAAARATAAVTTTMTMTMAATRTTTWMGRGQSLVAARDGVHGAGLAALARLTRRQPRRRAWQPAHVPARRWYRTAVTCRCRRPAPGSMRMQVCRLSSCRSTRWPPCRRRSGRPPPPRSLPRRPCGTAAGRPPLHACRPLPATTQTAAVAAAAGVTIPCIKAAPCRRRVTAPPLMRPTQLPSSPPRGRRWVATVVRAPLRGPATAVLPVLAAEAGAAGTVWCSLRRAHVRRWRTPCHSWKA